MRWANSLPGGPRSRHHTGERCPRAARRAIFFVAEDSGVPISARFCFYDQIHTTGASFFLIFLCAKAGMHMGVWLRMCSELSPLLDGAQEKLNIYSESLEGAPSFAFPCCTMACGRGMDIQHRLDAVAALTLGLKLKYNLHQTTWHFFSSSTEARIWCGAAWQSMDAECADFGDVKPRRLCTGRIQACRRLLLQ